MKTRPSLLILLTLLVLACRKDRQPSSPPPAASARDTLLLADVQHWYREQPAARALDWTQAVAGHNARGNYWLVGLPGRPTVQKTRQGYRKLAFWKDSLGQLQARFLEIVPDALYWQRKGSVHSADFSGYVYVFDESYHLLTGRIYSGGKISGQIRPGRSGNLRTEQAYVTADCNWYDNNYVDADGNAVIYSQQICNYTVIDDGNYPFSDSGSDHTSGDPLGGGGSGSDAPAPQIPELPSESAPAINPKDYMKCFGTLADAGATMQVTVYVQEPQPGTAFPLGVNGVGHTAIGLSKSNGSTTISQTIGFYPADHGQILGGPSKMVDNSGMAFNSSITYTVTADQFNRIVNYISTPPPTYDIYNFNCTNFAINACQQAGITLPNADTVVGLNGVGGWAHSMTPGGLGDSLDSMKGQPNVNNNGGTMPRSHGPCN